MRRNADYKSYIIEGGGVEVKVDDALDGGDVIGYPYLMRRQQESSK